MFFKYFALFLKNFAKKVHTFDAIPTILLIKAAKAVFKSKISFTKPPIISGNNFKVNLDKVKLQATLPNNMPKNI